MGLEVDCAHHHIKDQSKHHQVDYYASSTAKTTVSRGFYFSTYGVCVFCSVIKMIMFTLTIHFKCLMDMLVFTAYAGGRFQIVLYKPYTDNNIKRDDDKLYNVNFILV